MPETQQEPVIYLFLEETLGRHAGVLGSPVQVAYSHPNRHTEAKLKLVRDIYTPQKFRTGLGGNVAPVEAEGLHGRPESLFRVLKKLGLFIPKEKKPACKFKPYQQMIYPAGSGGCEDGSCPCIVDPELRLYQYTAIDGFSLAGVFGRLSAADHLFPR